MRTAEFDFELPEALIAQEPAPEREGSRLLVLHRETGRLEHRRFPELLDYLSAGDALVLNNSRVMAARLRGLNASSGGRFEMLLLEENERNDWWAMLRPGKRARTGTEIRLLNPQGEATGVRATVLATNAEGHRRLQFSGTANILDSLEELGEMPLPPYIKRVDAGRDKMDWQRYQTVFAEMAGSVAAPTAGLHFSESLLEQARRKGIRVCFVTLHVGLGTFAPVKSETVEGHTMHEERYKLNEGVAQAIAETRHAGRRVVAVGTTTVRVLESIAANHSGLIKPGAGRTKIFICPPYDFKVVDALVTNFHLPRSTLLMLASAFAAPQEIRGRELILAAYAEAVSQKYRFFSYGDAMLIL